MFTGDSSGSWLYEALHRHGFANQPFSTGRGDGLRLTDCYVTAAARCAPPANRPTPVELDRCQEYLEQEIRILTRVRIVVTLGRTGHERFLKASAGTRGSRRASGRRSGTVQSTLPDGRIVLCSTIRSRQNTNTGKLTLEMWHAIFARARELVDRS